MQPANGFKKGRSGNPLGRKKGVPNKSKGELKDWGKRVLESDRYREELEQRLIYGQAQPIEIQLYHYVYGKPKETVQHQGEIAVPATFLVEYVNRKRPSTDDVQD